MKVPASPTSAVGVNRPPAPAEGATAGRTERNDTVLQEDADLFKQAMSDTAKEPAGTTRRGETSAERAAPFQGDADRARASGSDTAARTTAFQGEPGKTRESGSDTAARTAPFQGDADRARESDSNTAARAAPFQGEPGKVQESGSDTAARAAAFQGEPGKAQEGGSETTTTVADKKDTTGLETTDETRAEAGVETQQDLQQLLATQVTQARMADPAQRVEASAPAAISSELVADVAQRILVSAGEHGQDKEVRIQVKDTVLNDTEVVIARQKGELVVVFETRSHTDNVLLSNSRDAIAASLQAALDGPVRVDVNAENPDTDPRDRHDRRSRGMYVQDDDV